MKRIDKATILGINAEKDLDTAGGTPSSKTNNPVMFNKQL